MPNQTNSGLRVGITIGLNHEAETLWNNGIKQNAVFLADALRGCARVQSVCLVNTTAVRITAALPWDQERWPTVTFDQAKDSLDVLIELGGQIDAAQTDYLKRQGAHVVSYCCGTEYVQTMESILFGKPSFGHNMFVNQRFDDIWLIPQVANMSQHFFTTLRRRAARVVPFVWDPIFVQARASELAHQGEYRPRPGPRRLTVMEPNINVVKFCGYPILIAEEAYRSRPDLVSYLHVTNSERLAKESPEFVSLMNQLDIVREHKASFVGRFDTPHFLSEFTDVVISHQWENPLNYLYLEVCWQGYAFVHNAHLCPDLGYYYPGNDVQAGRAALLQAMQTHDNHWEEYRKHQRNLIGRYLPTDPALVARYDDLLGHLREVPPI